MTTQPSYKIYQSAKELPQSWDDLHQNVFLDATFLNGQQNALPKNMTVFYVAFFNRNKLVAKTILQRIELKANELFPSQNQHVNQSLLTLLNANLLCVGNIKLTGENAFEIDEKFSLNEFSILLKSAIQEVEDISNKQKKTIHLILIKDFYEEKINQISKLFNGYHVLSVEPNMVLNIQAEWKSFDDYLNTMRSKYRTRVNRALKKLDKVSFVELNEKEISLNKVTIDDLYQNVLSNAEFSPYQLPDDYFYSMKESMKEKFKFYAGFLGGEIICFYTLIENKTYLETGFLGYHADLQHDIQLYLNMLYKMINYGIENQFKSIIFSRSALEIKSSVGAEPIESFGLIKHRNPILNKGLKYFFKQFYKPKEWLPRHPFKS